MTNPILRGGTILTAILALPLLADAAAGALMSITVTTRMDVPGAPRSVAGVLDRTTSTRHCVASGRLTDPQTWSTDGECVASDVHRSASGVSAHLTCKQMAGDLVVRLLPGGGAHGTLTMAGTGGGTHMSGVQTFDARRIGSCDAARPPG